MYSWALLMLLGLPLALGSGWDLLLFVPALAAILWRLRERSASCQTSFRGTVTIGVRCEIAYSPWSVTGGPTSHASARRRAPPGLRIARLFGDPPGEHGLYLRATVSASVKAGRERTRRYLSAAKLSRIS
jgi:hypothetical protein